ncbi:MAG: DUF5317 family protein [Candidatus Liptonbacteria bacterium]|nr:DUF5317 family protein [Candidatus Liptonbacteria bacterium]
MATWYVLTDLFMKILFGPWLFFEGKIPLLQKYYLTPRVSLAIGLTTLVVAIILRFAFRKKIEADLSGFSKTMFRILFGGAWAGLLGTLANEFASVANNSKMPVAPHSLNEYLQGGSSFVDRLHGIANANTKFFWLCDYIDPGTFKITAHLYPGCMYASPGDLANSAYFLIAWWVLLIFGFWGIYELWKKARKRLLRAS